MRILHLAFDPVLLQTREKILRQNEMQVVSLLGNASLAALPDGEIRSFDAVLLGHAASLQETKKAIAMLRGIDDRLPIVALKTHAYEAPLDGAYASVVADEPALWLDELKRCKNP